MILGNRSNTTVNKFDNIDFGVSIESCGYVDMFVEATEELSALESAIYVADIMLEEQVLEGAQDVEVMLESVMGSFVSRLRTVVEKLWAKVKQWFEKVKRYFGILFTKGKDFTKKYKVEILKAANNCAGFTYKFYAVNFGAFPVVAGLGDPFKLAKGLQVANPDKTNSEIVKDYMAKQFWGKEETQSEFNAKLREEVFGGTEREEFEEFKNGPSVADMIKYIEEGPKEIKELDKIEKELNKVLSETINELKKQENQAAKDAIENNASLPKAYSIAIELVKAHANHGLAICDINKTVVKTLAADSESVLKRLLTYKPKKENTTFEGEGQSESILEAALRFI